MSTTSLYRTVEGEKAVMAAYDALLSRWPVPHETMSVATRHGETFIVASGQPSTPPLLLLHGAGTNSSMWGLDVAAYSHSFRTCAIDLPGEAGRSAPNRPAWEGPAYTEWLDDVLTALKIERTALVGLSQGGWVALKYATANPERVTKLVLISPGGIIPDRRTFLPRALLYSLTGKWGARRMTRLLFAEREVSRETEERNSLLQRNFRHRIGTLPIFSDEQLRRLTMPTLLVGGTQDALRDIEKIAARLRSDVPQLEVILVPGGGHALVQTAEHILPFLSAPTFT